MKKEQKTKFAKIENGVVVQVQPNEEEGFIEVPYEVMPTQLYQNGKFVDPEPDVIEEKSIQEQMLIIWGVLDKLDKSGIDIGKEAHDYIKTVM